MRPRLVVVTIFALLALALAAPVGAAKPVPFTETVNESFVVDDVCAFPYTQTLVGTVTGRTFVDAAGTPVREIARIHIDGTFAANGVVVPFVIREVDHVTFNPDGSVTVASTGIIGRAKVAGAGRSRGHDRTGRADLPGRRRRADRGLRGRAEQRGGVLRPHPLRAPERDVGGRAAPVADPIACAVERTSAALRVDSDSDPPRVSLHPCTLRGT